MKQPYITLGIITILVLFIWLYISIADFTPQQTKDDLLLKKIMRNIIKKGLILFLLNLVVQTPVLSQITLDSTQSKTLCLILNEHEKLSNENPLLKEQVSSLEKLNQLYVESDSLQKEEIKVYEEKVVSDEKKIQRLKSTQKKILIGSSVGGILLFILGLIL